MEEGFVPPLILVVGDLNSNVLADVIAQNAEHMRFAHTSEPRTAHDLIIAQNPLLVLAAHAPPACDAFAVLRALRHKNPDWRAPAIVIAEEAMSRNAETRALGIREIVSRAAATSDDLLCALNNALEGERLRLRLAQSEADARSHASAEAERYRSLFENAPLYTTAIVEDVTEQIAADAALRASEERFRIFFNNSAFGAIEVDLDGQILRVNKALCDIGGWDEGELAGLRVIDLLEPQSRDGYLAARGAFFDGGSQEINGVWAFLRKDGSVAHLRLHIGVMRDGDGAPLYSCGVVIDVTEQIKAEQALRASEARYRAFFDNGAFGALEGDFFTRIVNVNRFFAELGGYAPQDMLGRPLLDFLHPDDAPEVLAVRDRLVSGEIETLSEQRRYRRKDGTYVWVRFRPAVLREETGAPAYICAIAEDISEELRAADALRASEARLRAVLDGAQDGILSIDGAGVIQSANAAAAALYGYERDELVGLPISALCAEPAQEGAPSDDHLDQDAIADGRPRVREGRRKDGSTFPFEIRKFRGQIDNAPLYVDFLRDLTERRTLEAQMEQLKAQRLAAMGGMAGALAHELNQPLAAIALHIETAQRLARLAPDKRPFSLAETLDSALSQTMRANEIIQHLRQFAARGEPDKSIQSLHALAREVCAGAPDKKVRIDLRLAAARDQVFVDQVQIKQLFHNLMRNAFDAMATAHDPALTLSTRNEGDMILVDFTDRGHGVSGDIADRLFEPLATKKPSGMGIGLSLSRAIASIHSGALTLSSSTAQGATFTLALPVHSGD